MSLKLFAWGIVMMNNEFYAVCERATDLMHIAIINKYYGKAELAYFKTLDEAEEFLRNLELYILYHS